MVSIFQTDSGIANMGWFGEKKDLIWCASMTRGSFFRLLSRIGLTIWNSTTGDRLANITDYYMCHCNEGRDIDYIVGCVEDKSHELLAIGGDQEGNGYLLSVQHPEQVVAVWKGHQVWVGCGNEYAECDSLFPSE